MNPLQRPWYEVDDAGAIDSPALLIYKDRVKENILRLIDSVPSTGSLRPHVKSHKSAAIVKLLMEKGISKFKCATIEEAAMLGAAGAPDALLAYPVVGPKAERLFQLIQQYPSTTFSCVIDDPTAVRHLSDLCIAQDISLNIYLDLNVGMNRTGVLPAHAMALNESVRSMKGIRLAGLHAYDGHIKEKDPEKRKAQCDAAFADVFSLKQSLEKSVGFPLTLIAGGTPTYLYHASGKTAETSPGTFIFWDKGYEEQFTEQPFAFAALLLSRVISVQSPGLICSDLGYKSVASENPQPRVLFLNAPEAVPVAHSEEHLTLSAPDPAIYTVGKPLYGVPWHICPSVALYEKALVIEDHRVTDEWVLARR